MCSQRFSPEFKDEAVRQITERVISKTLKTRVRAQFSLIFARFTERSNLTRASEVRGATGKGDARCVSESLKVSKPR
jgi:hypothetical protein